MFPKLPVLTRLNTSPDTILVKFKNFSTARQPSGVNLKQNKSEDLKAKYATIVSQCRSAIFKFDLAREEKILSANNLGAFYKFVNRKLKTNNGIAPLTDISGNIITSDIDKANLLNEYFRSVFTLDKRRSSTISSQKPPKLKLTILRISETIVRHILSKLKTNSAPGPRPHSPYFLQKFIYLNFLPLVDYLSYLHRSQESPCRMEALSYHPEIQKR